MRHNHATDVELSACVARSKAEMASALPRKTPTSGRPLHADKIMRFKAPSERDPLLGNGAPEDRCRLAYVIFFLHGIGHLLPWNFFITAQPVSRSLHLSLSVFLATTDGYRNNGCCRYCPLSTSR